MEYPKRKQLRLKEYDYASNGAYFVTICTHERRNMFDIVSSALVGAHLCVRPQMPGEMMAQWVLGLEQKYPHVTVDEFCVMPNHVHMIFSLRAHTQVRPYMKS